MRLKNLEVLSGSTLFIGGLAGLLTVDDLGPGFTLAWQLMVISSYFLVRGGRPAKVSARPALIYLIFMETAWLLITGSAFLAAGYQFGDSLATIGLKLASSSPWQAIIFFSLIFLGFGIKTGVFPFGQFWIPGAYSTAWPQVSSLLAGILERPVSLAWSGSFSSWLKKPGRLLILISGGKRWWWLVP